MPKAIPYTYYACPCTDISQDTTFECAQFAEPAIDTEGSEEGSTLNPANPRVNHLLYPLEDLLFCNECHEIRCARCYYEEALYYYCPNCLMETASTAVKTETNRCLRSCLQCPICSSALQLQSLADPDRSTSTESKPSKGNSSRDQGPFILACPYCAWSTLELGVKFEKGINITSQLAKARSAGAIAASRSPSASTEDVSRDGPGESTKSQFDGLRDFYNTALADTNPHNPVPGLGTSFGFDSPSHLSRILNQYGVGGLKKQRPKPVPMREVLTDAEGLNVERLDLEDGIIDRMKAVGWAGTATVEQQAQQVHSANSSASQPDTRIVDHLWPTPFKLRTRRSKRCQQCRYHLVRPDDKRHSARYKLRLLALNYIPRVSATSLNVATTQPDALAPGAPQQFVLTCRNPLYDPVRVKLGTPSTVSGTTGSRITILCPQFDVGASADVWDEALSSSKTEVESTAARGAAEAGKIWKKGRNWTSVVLEIVPGYPEESPTASVDLDESKLLEIPILVRMEYFTDASNTAQSGWDSPENSPGYKSVKEERAPKEIEFWVVVGLGSVARRPVS